MTISYDHFNRLAHSFIEIKLLPSSDNYHSSFLNERLVFSANISNISAISWHLVYDDLHLVFAPQCKFNRLTVLSPFYFLFHTFSIQDIRLLHSINVNYLPW